MIVAPQQASSFGSGRSIRKRQTLLRQVATDRCGREAVNRVGPL